MPCTVEGIHIPGSSFSFWEQGSGPGNSESPGVRRSLTWMAHQSSSSHAYSARKSRRGACFFDLHILKVFILGTIARFTLRVTVRALYGYALPPALCHSTRGRFRSLAGRTLAICFDEEPRVGFMVQSVEAMFLGIFRILACYIHTADQRRLILRYFQGRPVKALNMWSTGTRVVYYCSWKGCE